MTKEHKKHIGEGGSHYKENRAVETSDLMEQVASNVYSDTSDIKKALWSAISMKHLDRAGTKKGAEVDDELLKVENYVHRARTGNWIIKQGKGEQ